MAQQRRDTTQATAATTDERAPSQVWATPRLHASGPTAATVDPDRTGSELTGRPGTPVLGVSPMVIVDVETTGLGACPPERVVEVAAPGTPVAGLETLVDPGVPIPPQATATHGISDVMVATAPPFEAVAGRLARLLAGAILVGHSASFDYSFLYGEYRRLGRRLPRLPMVCTRQLTRRLRPDQPRYRLAACCRAFGLDDPAGQAATAGATATAGLLRRLLPLATSQGVSPLLDQPAARPWLLPDGWGEPWPVTARLMARSAPSRPAADTRTLPS